MLSRLLLKHTAPAFPQLRVVVTQPKRTFLNIKKQTKEEAAAEEERHAKIRAEIEREFNERLSKKGQDSARTVLIKRVFIGLGVTVLAHGLFYTYASRMGVFQEKGTNQPREISEEEVTQLISPTALEVMRNSPELYAQLTQKKDEEEGAPRMYKVSVHALMEQLDNDTDEKAK